MRFDNPKDRDSIREVLKQGVKADFWKIIIQGLDAIIENLQKEQDSEGLKELPAEQYKVESEILKAKRKYLKDLKEFPQTLLSDLDDPNENNKPEDLDPY